MYVLDPAPTCGITSRAPIIQGQKVTLTCAMTYYAARVSHIVRPSISWESAAGSFLSNSSTLLKSGEGGTLQVDVETVASGDKIPSYNCTSVFQFTDPVGTGITHVLNSVSWTCFSEPVLIWCMYYRQHFYKRLISFHAIG